MRVRSIELGLPQSVPAATFLAEMWGLVSVPPRGVTQYLRGGGTFPYLIALEEGPEPSVRSTPFVCSLEELSALQSRVAHSGLNAAAVESTDPGQGTGLI